MISEGDSRTDRSADRGRWVLGVAALVTILAGCEASRDGTALLHNASHRAFLEVVVRDPHGRRLASGTLEKVYVFDTQFTNREKQCLVAHDGGFEVLGPNGEVIASHSFADRPVCEFDELVLEADGSLVWK